MITQLPRIAIPEPTSHDPAYNQRSLPEYIHAVEAAGGEAVTLSLEAAPADQAALLSTCSGILLPGSPADVDPRRYGQEPVKACAAKDAARESMDDFLLSQVFHSGKPLLGICFGLQSLNVYCHGTLIQDLPATEGSDSNKPLQRVNHQPGRTVLEAHPIRISPGTRLAELLTVTSEATAEPLVLQVNSSHHQAIGQPAETLLVAARSLEDGVIEALEIADRASGKFIVAVQWHPERSYDSSSASREIFSAFVTAAAEWSQAPSGKSIA